MTKIDLRSKNQPQGSEADEISRKRLLKNALKVIKKVEENLYVPVCRFSLRKGMKKVRITALLLIIFTTTSTVYIVKWGKKKSRG